MLGLGELNCIEVECAYETWGDSRTPTRRQRRAGLPRDLRRLARVNASRHAARGMTIPVGGTNSSSGRASGLRSTPRTVTFVICSNVLGRLPRHDRARQSATRRPGKPYGADFPPITVADMVDGAGEAAGPPGGEETGGGGGGVAGRAPGADLGDALPPARRVRVCRHRDLTPAHVAGAGLRRHRPQRDPAPTHTSRAAGTTTNPSPARRPGSPSRGMLGHITYLSSEAMAREVRRRPPRPAQELATRLRGTVLRRLVPRPPGRASSPSGSTPTATSTLSMAMDLFDLGADARRSGSKTLAPVGVADWLVDRLFSSDWLFTPPGRARQIVEALTAMDRPVTYAEVTSRRRA